MSSFLSSGGAAHRAWCYLFLGIGVLALAANIVFNSFTMGDWDTFQASESPMDFAGGPGNTNWWLFGGAAIALAFLANSRSKILAILLITILYFWFDTLRNWDSEKNAPWYRRRTLWSGCVGSSVALVVMGMLLARFRGVMCM